MFVCAGAWRSVDVHIKHEMYLRSLCPCVFLGARAELCSISTLQGCSRNPVTC